MYIRFVDASDPLYLSKIILDWEARPAVSWDWWISPSSSTFLLRQEFRLMANK